MRSNLQDQRIRTNCKNCVFAIYDNSDTPTQTGCSHNRIEKYEPDVIEAYDNEKNFYVIDRLCTYYRDNSWGYENSDIEKVERESALSFDLIFDCNDVNEKQKQSIIDFINDNNYYEEKANIILMHENHRYDIAKPIVTEISKNISRNVTISVCLDKQNFMFDLLKKTKNAYHCLVSQPEDLSIDILQRLNNYVNIDMKKFVFAKDGPNKFVGNFKYKSLNEYNPGIDYLKNIDEIENFCKPTDLYIEW